MKEADDHMQNCDFLAIPHRLDRQLWDQLRATKKKVKHANQRAEKAKANVKKMEDRIQLEKTKLGVLLDAKDETTSGMIDGGDEAREGKGRGVGAVCSCSGGILCRPNG